MIENSIKVINTYLDRGMWVFDEPLVGLVKEPFVAGADTLLSYLAQGEDHLQLIFSDIPFRGWKISAHLIDTVENGQGGSDYYCTELDHDLWLCPQLLKYFKSPPDVIYLNYK